VRDPEDHDLVQALRRHDPRALTRIYDQHRARIFGFLIRLSRRRAIAEELLQEVFLKLARHGHELRDDTDLQAWLFTVARNAFLGHRRWAAFDMGRLVAIDDRDFPSEGDDEARFDARRRLSHLERALAELSDDHREVLLLVGVEGFDHERAATILGLRPDALRQRLLRARAKLESALEKIADEPLKEVIRGTA
jgi:RNA polymerase sigma-70 factor (ECF subfamily)